MKKLIALMLAVIMVLSLTGCKDKKDKVTIEELQSQINELKEENEKLKKPVAGQSTTDEKEDDADSKEESTTHSVNPNNQGTGNKITNNQNNLTTTQKQVVSATKVYEECGVEVPDVVGSEYGSAQTLIVSNGFTSIQKLVEYTDDVDPGYVIKTEPAAGTKVDTNTTIYVTIAVESKNDT